MRGVLPARGEHMDACMSSFDPAVLSRFGRVRVHLCVNDNNGHPLGRLLAVTVNDDVDIVVSLITDDVGVGVGAEIVHGRGWDASIAVEDVGTFPLTDYRTWVGNICWDAGYMTGGAVRAFVAGLVAIGFHVDEWAEL